MGTRIAFSHHSVSDPFAIYEDMLATSPIYFDANEKIWAVYSYDSCLRVLQASEAWIPEIPPGRNQIVNSLTDGLARLANGAEHQLRREIVTKLFASWEHPDVTKVLDDTIERIENNEVFDWVTTVGVRLPALTLLKGFQLRQDAIEKIISVLPGLVKLMSPTKNKSDVDEIMRGYEVVVNYAWPAIVNSGLTKFYDRNLVLSNFIGILIQGYDSGIGSLCNILFHYVNLVPPRLIDDKEVKGFVLETFRYAPPFHNTRRVMKMALDMENKTIQTGDTVVVFLAAANRDPTVFPNPGNFDRSRANAGDALTFGSGRHACIAKSFSETLACTLVKHLLHSAFEPEFTGQTIVYQDKVNARIPASLFVRLKKK